MKSTRRSSRGLFLSCLISQGVWVVSAILILLVFCAIANSMEDPQAVLTPLSLCALYLSTFICGYTAVKISDEIIAGLVSGAINICVILLISALPLPGSDFSIGHSIMFLLLIIPSNMLGAFVGKKRKRKPKRLSKHKRP